MWMHLVPFLLLSLASTQTTPYYLEGVQYLAPMDGSGPLTEHHKTAIARRADGVKVVIEYGPNAHREILFPGGARVVAYDNLKMKSTYHAADQPESPVQQEESCHYRGVSEGHAQGAERLFGLELGVFEWTDNSRIQTVTKRAPAIGCADLYQRVSMRQADGSYRVTAEFTVNRLVLGEPDPALFDVGSDFTEVPPSQVIRLLLEPLMSAASADDRVELQRDLARLDARYFAARAPQPK